MHRSSWILYLCSLLFAVFAMKTKEIAFTLPVVIALYEFLFFNISLNVEHRKPTLRRLLYLFPILLTILIIPLNMVDIKKPLDTVVESVDVQSRETANITRTDYLFTQFRVIVTYLRLLVFPVNQNLDYRYPIYSSFFNPQVFLSFLFLLAIFGIAVYLFYASRVTPVCRAGTGRHHVLRLTAFGIFWFFITLSVESSFIPIRDVIVEHRLYLPSIGFFIFSILAIDTLIKDQRTKTSVIIALVLVLSVSTFSRNELWRNPQKLWEDVLTKFPDNVRAFNSLGVIYKENEEYEKSSTYFKKVLEINPNYYPAYYNLGDIQYKLGNYESAIAYFKKTLEFKLSYYFKLDALTSLAIAYSDMGNDENALSTFTEILKLYPLTISAYNNLGKQYIKMGKYDLAVDVLEKGLKIRDDAHIRYNLSVAKEMKP